jgi:hypothetical protein
MKGPAGVPTRRAAADVSGGGVVEQGSSSSASTSTSTSSVWLLGRGAIMMLRWRRLKGTQAVVLSVTATISSIPHRTKLSHDEHMCTLLPAHVNTHPGLCVTYQWACEE